MAATVSSRDFRSSDGVRLNVLEAGAEEAAGVIALVPGWSMPASLWRDSMLRLAAHYRVVALDPRGQGDSERPAHGYDFDRRAEDIAEFVARYRPVLLVGWSLGALESLQSVHLHGADTLRGLAIVDSSVGELPAPPASTQFRAELLRDRKAAMEHFVRALFKSPQPDALIAQLLEQALRLPLEASLSLFPSRLPREHWLGIVERFSKPLLYAVTAQFAQQAENLRRRRPDTRIEIFADAGHALFVDEPERFARLLREFAATLMP